MHNDIEITDSKISVIILMDIVLKSELKQQIQSIWQTKLDLTRVFEPHALHHFTSRQLMWVISKKNSTKTQA